MSESKRLKEARPVIAPHLRFVVSVFNFFFTNVSVALHLNNFNAHQRALRTHPASLTCPFAAARTRWAADMVAAAATRNVGREWLWRSACSDTYPATTREHACMVVGKDHTIDRIESP